MTSGILKHPLTILFSVVVGIAIGLYNGSLSALFGVESFAQIISIPGQVYLFYLQMTVIPIIITAISSSIGKLIRNKSSQGLIRRMCLAFLAGITVTALAGMAIGILGKPGADLGEDTRSLLTSLISSHPSGDSEILEVSLSGLQDAVAAAKFGIGPFLISLVPSNIFSALAQGSTMAVVFFSIAFGIAIGFVNDQSADTLIKFLGAVFETFQKLVSASLYLLPFGLVCLIAGQIAQVGVLIFMAMSKFIILYCAGTAVLFVIMTVIIWVRSGIANPFKVLSLLFEPVMLAFATRNSMATLPSAITCLDEKMNFDQTAVNLTMPLGITVGRFGNVFYFAVAVFFVVQIYGVELTAAQYATVFLGVILAGTATAGASGIVTISVISIALTPLDLPVEAVLVIFMAIDPIIDPFRTCLLVHGNMCATALTAKKKKNGTAKNFLTSKSGISQNPVLREQRMNLDLPPAQLPVVKNWFWRMRIFKVKYVIIFINVISLVFSAGIILSSMWISSEKNARDLSEALISEIQGALSIRLVNYFDPVAEMNNRTGYLLSTVFANPLESPEGKDAIFGYYSEILRTNQRVKMAYYTDTHGNLMMLNRMEDGSFSRRTVRNDGKTITTTWNHANVMYYGNYSNSVLDASEGYDPRKRGWYLTAQEQRKPAWTPVYIFATDHLPGFTSVVPIYDNKGILSGVSAMDITVDEISRFLATMHSTPGTKIALIDSAHNLVAFQTRTEADLDKLFVEVTDENGASAFDVRKIDMFPEDDVRFILGETLKRGGGSCTVKYNGESYRSVLAPTPIGHGLELLIGIIIPEDDIIGNVKENLLYVTLFSMVVLVIIIVITSLFSNSIARPMQRLAEEMSKVRNFQLDSVVAIPTALIEITNIHEAFEGMRTGLRNFKRYVPAALVAQLINEEIDAKIGGEKREMSVFFSDIANFTAIAEKIGPEELVQQLRIYFENVSKTILDNRGTIDKYIGDSVMAFWGAPIPSKNHAEMACRSAVRIQAILQSISRKWLNSGKEPFYTRIGIHTGEVIVGNVGYEERLNYTVLGDSVNLASRLEGVNKMYDTRIIVSHDTWNQCSSLFEFRRLDKISVKGRHGGIMIYELHSEKGEIERSQRRFFSYYEKGLEYYFNRDFSEALKYFNAVLKYQATDGPSRVMRERCLRYKEAPPPEDWNGTFVLNKK